MSRTIHVLPDLVANQIAAGEVVERPASVVKELVENALDARATAVGIALERGGKRRIRVADDGSGMGREDALLSLDRHATSKIQAATDLSGVRTFGFRGEALPSIAAVSRLTLQTRSNDEEVGTAIHAKGGRISTIDDFTRRRGTTVEVENLFLNAPARAKFLSSVNAETRAVSEAVTALALANPAVSFTLTSDGRPLLELPKARDLLERVAGIWGDEAAEGLLPLRGNDAAAAVRGLVQRPDRARPGFRRAYLYVDRRPFSEPALLRAVERGYRTTIPEKVRPWIFLYLRVPAGSVDVNVHPAKAEVRFRDRRAVEAAVEEAVRRALSDEASSATFDTELSPRRLAVREPTAQKGRTPVRRRPAGDEEDRDHDPAPDDPVVRSGAGGRGGRDGPSRQMALFLSGEELLPGDTAAEASSASTPREVAPPRLWQIHDTYILAETRDGVLLIDQHSAHERILFEELMRAYGDGGQTVQRLLFPITVRLSPTEYGEVMSLQSLLARSGFEVEGFGGDTVIVQGVPNPHPYFEPERCFREMIAELAHGSELVRSAGNQHERIAMTFACKGAIKAGQRLDPKEMQELFDRLFGTELPYHDVHGRPTIVRLSRAELERKFGR